MRTADLAELGIEQWAIDDGLGSNWVRDIAEDGRGFLWVATHGGLVRFDGRRFRSALPAAEVGPSDAAVSSLARSPDGSVESVHLPGRAFVVGVQWHPELLDDPRLFAAFAAAAR